MVAVLINLPWVHETWVGHRIDAQGRDVEAVVTEHRTVKDRHFVEFKLPKEVDPAQHSYTARIDTEHFDAAASSSRLGVRVVPGHPADNRPDGEVGGGVFAVAAVIGDAILFLFAFVIWVRRRRWSRRRVTAIDADLVTFEMADLTLTAQAQPALLDGLVVGSRLAGVLVLRAESDVQPAAPVGAVEHLGGARYRMRGRVRDVSRTRTDLLLDNGYVLRVQSGEHRNRADLREPAEVTGTLTAVPGLD